MMAVTARAAKTNFAIWALLRQLLPCLLTSGNLQGRETPRSEAIHTTMALARLRAGVAGVEKSRPHTGNRPLGGGPTQIGFRPAPTLCAQRAGASTRGGRSRQLNVQARGKAPSPRESAGGRFERESLHMLRTAERVQLPRPRQSRIDLDQPNAHPVRPGQETALSTVRLWVVIADRRAHGCGGQVSKAGTADRDRRLQPPGAADRADGGGYDRHDLRPASRGCAIRAYSLGLQRRDVGLPVRLPVNVTAVGVNAV
jgi:hypothetical protein